MILKIIFLYKYKKNNIKKISAIIALNIEGYNPKLPELMGSGDYKLYTYSRKVLSYFKRLILVLVQGDPTYCHICSYQ